MHLQSKRHIGPLERTCSTTRLRQRTHFRRNVVQFRHFVRHRRGPAGRDKAGVTTTAASVIGASRRRRLLVASNHGTAPVIRAPAGRTDVPAGRRPSRLFSYIMPVKPMTYVAPHSITG